MSKGGDDAFIRDLNKTTTPQEARQLIVNQIIPECRDIGNNFFQCLEKKLEKVDAKTTKFDQIEKMLNEGFIPECRNSFNLEECLKKNGKQ
jgi:hypothetical protein